MLEVRGLNYGAVSCGPVLENVYKLYVRDSRVASRNIMCMAGSILAQVNTSVRAISEKH